jgi:hypothetical protein
MLYVFWQMVVEETRIDDLADLFLADWIHLPMFGVVGMLTAETAECLKTVDKMVIVPRVLDYDTEWVWNADRMRVVLLLKSADVKLWMNSEQLV